MLLHIVEGRDQNHLVAKVKLRRRKVTLDVFDQTYEKYLRELFSTPFHRFTMGGRTHDGFCFDVGETIQPWDPKVIEVLPEKLCVAGLKPLVIDLGNKRATTLKQVGVWLLLILGMVALIFGLLALYEPVSQLFTRR
jgi:hypothetical protein